VLGHPIFEDFFNAHFGPPFFGDSLTNRRKLEIILAFIAAVVER
jgi:hypothetical protein